MKLIQAREVILLLTVALLTACGGGGGGSDDAPAVTATASALAPANTDDDPIGKGKAIEAEPITGDLLCRESADDSAVENLPVMMSSDVPLTGAAITVERVFENLEFDQPVLLLQAPGDADFWYVVEQAGRILRFENDPDVTESDVEVFLDISDRVDSSSGTLGLLGMAFHPDYSSSDPAYVYLYYLGTNNSPSSRGLASFVSRFETNAGKTELLGGSENILINFEQPFENNNGGSLAFGADGFLYIGFGDGGGQGDPNALVRNNQNLFGSFARIDVDSAQIPYGIPPDNPFASGSICSNGSANNACAEIYACGFRNPFRWSFDTLTGDLWAGDVGQTAREEIDTVVKNGNYGWPFFQGTLFNANFPGADPEAEYVSPATEYSILLNNQAVTGGYVYRGDDIDDLIGVYLYADYFTGDLFQYYFNDGSGDRDAAFVNVSRPTGLRIVAFGEAANGELFLVDYDFLNPTGLYRIFESDGDFLPPPNPGLIFPDTSDPGSDDSANDGTNPIGFVPPVNLDEVEFPVTDLDAVEFPATDLDAVEFPVTDLDEVEFPVTDLDQVEFPVTDLDEVEFPATDLDAVEFPATDLDEVEFPATDLDEVEFPATDLDEVEFPATDLDAVDFPVIDL
ncbi:MAG: PQQ-dependent sugar dehydrogenase [Gammaproteobacteria bacterium]